MVSARRLVVLLLLCGLGQLAQAANVTALRSWRAPDNTRLVLDVSGPVQFRISPDSTPAQLILELDDSQASIPAPVVQGAGPVKAVHFESKGGTLRLLIDLSAEVNPHAFELAPNEKYGQRLVVDLFDHVAASPVAPVVAAPAASAIVALQSPPVVPPPAAPAVVPPAALPAASTGKLVTPDAVVRVRPPLPTPSLPPPTTAVPEQLTQATDEESKADMAAAPVVVDKSGKHGRNIIIAIDPGHGGEDPGAIGMNGTYEKNVTLAIARDLVTQLRQQPGITAVLTRDGDYYVPLQERRQIARYKDKADLFISVHADSAPSREAKGASVFALSLKGANTATSRFAAMLAERENRADLIGGVAIEKDDNDSVLRNVLADMVVTGSLEHSLHMAHNIIGNLDQIGRLHSKQVEQAGFAVLKEPGMVSLLVETGFISNPDEEKRLTNPVHQHEIAHAIMGGALRYCEQYPAPGTYFAWEYDQQHGHATPEDMPRKKHHAEQVASAETASVDTTKATGSLIRHKVQVGDSLTQLAVRYQTTPATLKALNGMDDDNVKIGQVLKIPAN